jgi:hypothetical protein
MVILMKVNGNKIKNMAMVFIKIKEVIDTLEIGKTTKLMVMVFITVQTVLCIKVYTKLTKKQD